MSFTAVLKEHIDRYPEMTPQDFCKLAYQSEFGPCHMLDNCEEALVYIDREWSALTACEEKRDPEYIGNGLSRFYMNGSKYSKEASELLGKLFYLTAKEHQGSGYGLEKRLSELEKLSVSGMTDYLADYRRKGCNAVHHSEIYNERYNPHYRLIKKEYAFYFDLLLKIMKLKKPCIISIDGRCGSGKTSLASIIKTVFDCNVFHTDDYYLPMDERPEGWERIPGGNIDYIRFKNDVVITAKNGDTVNYTPYNCGKGEYGEAVTYSPKDLTVIEGSYSQHRILSYLYDLKIFLTCDEATQEQRLKNREGDYFVAFKKLWIPMEEFYIFSFDVELCCDYRLDTSKLF